jgi:multiple sugar transport system permease protein
MGALMLGNALTLLPLIIVFAFFSRQIISGLTAGAVKQ